MITLRDYQEDIAYQGFLKLKSLKIVYLAMEVRTGKTLTALSIADRYLNNTSATVLFVTKKKAISSIQADYRALNPNYKIHVINYESLHKVRVSPSVLILDEAHKLGAYPKPSQSTKVLREKYSHCPIIFLSGTPTPESYSQIFNQLHVSKYSPFSGYASFYLWAKDFVKVTQRTFAHGTVNDYSEANEEKVKIHSRQFFLTYTQKEAGFETKVNENILFVEMEEKTQKIIKILKRDLVVNGKDDVILADTPVKLMQKVHQLSSGTCIGESGNVILLDKSKATFIHERFRDKKIAIFYKFTGELKLLQSVYKDYLTTDLEEFKTTKKNIALQIVSGREGISLKEADYLVFFNIDFSAVSYWQSRDRLTTKERASNDIYWVFSKGGIEENIYKTVQQKKDYTLSHYKKCI
jgi:hypothetical protein